MCIEQRQLNKNVATGFTLIELMITVLVLAVLLTVAAPSFTDMVANNRMRSEVYALRGLLSEARSEALNKRTLVSVCASSNSTACTGNWNEGYIAFFDADGDGVVDVGDRIVLSRTNKVSTVTIDYSNAYILYNSRGNAQNNAITYNGSFSFCDERGATHAAALIVSLVGSVSAAVDSDDPVDEIPNDPNNDGGDNLACT